MRVVSNKKLREFAARYPEADTPLQAWRRLVEAMHAPNFAMVKRFMNATDKVGDFHVFDIGGNKFRIVVGIDYVRQIAYIKHVFTHGEYDKWSRNQ